MCRTHLRTQASIPRACCSSTSRRLSRRSSRSSVCPLLEWASDLTASSRLISRGWPQHSSATESTSFGRRPPAESGSGRLHTMEKTQVNPWTWQDRRGFSQAWKVEDGRTVIFVSGQVSVSDDGRLAHEGDFAAQTRLVFENLRTVLNQAGATLD